MSRVRVEQPCPGKANAGDAGMAELLPWDVAFMEITQNAHFPSLL